MNMLRYPNMSESSLDGPGKCQQKSESIRQKGNDLFKAKKWLKAAKMYSKSIALAENGTVELGFAYANRSALLFYRGFFKECLEDIERALQVNYPKDKKAPLLARREHAVAACAAQKKNIKPDDIPSLEGKNSSLRGASDAIKLSENQQYGRFIEANRDITPGEILTVEDSFVLLISDDCKTIYCGHCGKLCFNLIPCKKCCTEMYCSEICKADAHTLYHQYECIIMNFNPNEIFEHIPFELKDMKAMQKEQILQFSLRMTLKGFSYFQNYNTTATEEDIYAEVGELQTHRNDLNDSAFMILALNCARQFKLLKKHTSFISKLKFKDKENILKYHLFRNRLIACFNLATLQYQLDQHDQTISVGLGLYPTCSMFNHSCVPNVACGYYGKTMVIKAIRTIKKGEQCFINYNSLCRGEGNTERINFKSEYLFDCDCLACLKDWPSFEKSELLKHNSKSPIQITLKAIANLLKQQNKSVQNYIKEIFDIAVDIEPSISFQNANTDASFYYTLLTRACMCRFKGYDF